MGECKYHYCGACTYPNSGLVCRQVIKDKEQSEARRRRTGPIGKFPKTAQARLGVYTQPHRWGGRINNIIKRELLRNTTKRQRPVVGERREPQNSHGK